MGGVVPQQHAHLGEAVAQHEALDDLDHAWIVVQRRLEIGSEDRDQALARGDDGGGRLAHLANVGQHLQFIGRGQRHGEPRRLARALGRRQPFEPAFGR